ncbi:MAG: PAS domain S-box protein [Treponema sp.]|nr:PAS domain S-box protein [Treponema sp.]
MSSKRGPSTGFAIQGPAVAGLAYFLTQMLGFYFPDADKVIMGIWPPAGVGLAAFLLLPKKRWPLLALAIFIAGNLANMTIGRNLLLSLGFMGVNLLESWLGALVVLRLAGGPPRMDRLVDCAAIGVAATIVNAVTGLAAAGLGWILLRSDPIASWFSWWIGDGLGILVIAPMILAVAKRESVTRWLRLPSILEFAIFFALWAIVGWQTFDASPLHGFYHNPPYILILLIFWPAYRFSARTISFASLVLAFIALTSRAVSLGPSPMGGENGFARLQNIELFLAILTFGAYVLSTALAELRQARLLAEDRLAEQKSAEEGLRAREERLRAIFDGAADGIAIAGLDEEILEINDAGREILGLAKDERLDLHLADIVSPEALGRLGPTGAPTSTDSLVIALMTTRRRDGSRIELESRSRKMPSGETVSVLRDVTERHFERRLTELRIKLLVVDTNAGFEELLGAALDEAETVTDSVMSFFHMVGGNHERLELTAWSKNTLATMCSKKVEKAHYPIAEAGIWADAARLARPVIHNYYPSEVGRKGLPEGHAEIKRELVVPIIRSGVVVAILGVGNKGIPYDEGDLRRALALGEIAWDIADRKFTKSLLKETEERFALVFRHSPMPAAITRAESGIFLDVNNAYIALFGYAKHELIGRGSREVGIWVDPEIRKTFDGIIEGRSRIVSFEGRFRKKNGEIVEAFVTSEGVSIDGELHLVSQVEDITERKLASHKIQKALAEKEVLLRELYHRANNNMQVISALLDFQAVAIGDERLSQAIEATQNRIGALALVNRKLYEAQDLSYINLRDYIVDLLDVLSQGDWSHGRSVEIKTDLESIPVIVDTAIPCGLILNELISNVYLHAYPDGTKGLMEIGLRRLPTGEIGMKVADFGIGLPPEFDIERDGKIGLQNIVGLCSSQLRGTVHFDRTKGLACEVIFADNLYKARV